MNQSIIFFFNGKKFLTKRRITLKQLIIYFNFDSSFCIIEYNSKIYNSNFWSLIYLKNFDKIEIITIVGGG